MELPVTDRELVMRSVGAYEYPIALSPVQQCLSGHGRSSELVSLSAVLLSVCEQRNSPAIFLDRGHGLATGCRRSGRLRAPAVPETVVQRASAWSG